MFSTVISTSVTTATTAWSALPRLVLNSEPKMLLIIGRRAIGKVAQTDATVRIPAIR